ncbi:MAG: hypothetical protein JXA20_11510 [Spirochaetes bacterium]|nr:hypothetical protein [Spirochaetota bacterium]
MAVKPNVIRINDIHDIDTTRISVYDLNNRYIDRLGNMYGVKYNPLTRKVEIIRIIRAVEKEVATMQQRILKKKLSEMPPNEDRPEEPPEQEEEKSLGNFEPELFIGDCMKIIATHRSRIKGIIMNIKNSNVFPKENKHESIELENIFRNLEIDGERAFDMVDNYQKELTGYPRSISYYQAKIDNRGNQIVEAMGDDKTRIMKFIYMYEMYTSISELYHNLLDTIMQLKEKVSEKNPDDIKHIAHNDKQAFLDAKTSLTNTIDEIHDLMDKMRQLEQFVLDPGNF